MFHVSRPSTPLLHVALLTSASFLPLSVFAQDAPSPLFAPDTELSVSEGSVGPAQQPEALTSDVVQTPAIEAEQISSDAQDFAATETADLSTENSAQPPVNDAAAAHEEQPQTALDNAMAFLADGGPSIWAIAALSVATTALILWKIWRLTLIGAWSKGKARRALMQFENGDADGALAVVRGRHGLRSRVVAAAIEARITLPEEAAREETARVAKRDLGDAGTGLRALELIATIAPLLGLLGTVLGMISAFQALQESGSQADPSQLAGGIWEALLTTAAGMAVAIPASAALTWFEAVLDRMRRDIEDAAMRIFVFQGATQSPPSSLAAE